MTTRSEKGSKTTPVETDSFVEKLKELHLKEEQLIDKKLSALNEVMGGLEKKITDQEDKLEEEFLKRREKEKKLEEEIQKRKESERELEEEVQKRKRKEEELAEDAPVIPGGHDGSAW